jgi:predicted dienelactone hydrolase
MKRIVLALFALSFLTFHTATLTASQCANIGITDYKSLPAPEEAFEVAKLPQPTGNYKIGTAIFHLIDNSRKDRLGSNPDSLREIMVQVWYPAEVSKQQKTAPYFPDARLIDAMRKDGFYDQKPEVIDGLKDVSTHSILDAPIVKSSQKLPLILFSHGLGTPRPLYTSIAEELASYGYIVASIDHPSGGMTVLPDGRVLTAIAGGTPEEATDQAALWAGDASFVLDQLTDSKNKSAGRFASRIDINRIGMAGHSLGGAAALEVSLRDKRLKACANMDGAPFGRAQKEGTGCHTFVLRSSPDYSDEDLARKGRTRQQWEEMGRKGREAYAAVLQNRPGIAVYNAKIKGTGHMSFSDAPFVMPDMITRFGGRIIEPARGMEIISAYLRAFFDKHLLNKPSSLLEGPSKLYPEVSIEVFGK